jgi:hypothetical protein
MKIGIMLRHLGQHGGGVLGYTRNLMRELLTLDSPHEFILMYPDQELMGSFGNRDNVREVVVRARLKFEWDQVAVRQVEKKEKLDMLKRHVQLLWFQKSLANT